jgi:hypothetical protein
MSSLLLVTLGLSLVLLWTVKRRRRSKYWNKYAAVAAGFLDFVSEGESAISSSTKSASAGAGKGAADDDQGGDKHVPAALPESSMRRRAGKGAPQDATPVAGASVGVGDSDANVKKSSDASVDEDDDEDDSDAEREMDAKAAKLSADIIDMAQRFAEFKSKHSKELS